MCRIDYKRFSRKEEKIQENRSIYTNGNAKDRLYQANKHEHVGWIANEHEHVSWISNEHEHVSWILYKK